MVKEGEISLELSRVQGALEAKAQAAREESEAAQAQLQQVRHTHSCAYPALVSSHRGAVRDAGCDPDVCPKERRHPVCERRG